MQEEEEEEEEEGASLLHADRPSPSLSSLVLYFMAIHFLLAFCEIILVAPLIKLFEDSLCQRHYGFPKVGVGEELCKSPEIQGKLATIRGWKSMFDTIPVLLVAIPIGKLGDRYGRRKIMALSLLGVFTSLVEIFTVCAYPKVFSLQLVWLSSIFLLCGGGLNAASAFMWAMASELIPSSRRSHAFYYIFSAFYVAELIASFLASVTIDFSPWLPCGMAMGSIIFCLALLWLMPAPSIGVDMSTIGSPGIRDDENRTFVNQANKHPVTSLINAMSNIDILLTIPVFLVGIFRYTTLNILIQYSSVHFGLRISTGAMFYTETAVVNIILFLFLIPLLSAHIRTAYGIRPQSIDLYLVRSSVSLMSVGCLSIGLAPASIFLPPAVLIFAAGFGSRVSALSLVSYWISDDSKATLYAAITVLESLGHCVGDPSMQQIFAASLRLPPFWQALPFFVSSALYFLAGLSTSFIRIKRSSG